MKDILERKKICQFEFREWLLKDFKSQGKEFSEIFLYQDDYQKLAGEIPVLVNVAKIDELWKKTDPGYHIPPFHNSSKYKSAYEKITKTKKAVMPRIGIHNDDQYLPLYGIPFHLGFDDGRHTFAVIRDLGIKKIKVSADVGSAKHLLNIASE